MRKFLNYHRAFLGAALFSIASRGRWLIGLLCCTAIGVTLLIVLSVLPKSNKA